MILKQGNKILNYNSKLFQTENTISLVNHVDAFGNADSNTSMPIDTRGANLIVVCMDFLTFSSPILTDSVGNVYIALPVVSGWSDISSSQIYYCINPITDANHIFSTTGGGYPGIQILAFSNYENRDFIFSSNNETKGDGENSIQAGIVTPTLGYSLVVTCTSPFSVSPANLITIDSGFNITDAREYIGGLQFSAASAYLIHRNNSPINPTWTWNMGSGDAASAIALFNII